MEQIINLIERYPKLSQCADEIKTIFDKLVSCFESGGRVYVFGNGGSAADALHIAGELGKSFMIKRPLDIEFVKSAGDELKENLQGALPAFALVENISLASAFANDCNPQFVIAQQVYAYARKGDCALGISTSGNSINVIHGLNAAKGRGALALGLTGGLGDNKMKKICDYTITVPEDNTYRIQELHQPIYHTLCLMLEQHFWGNK